MATDKIPSTSLPGDRVSHAMTAAGTTRTRLSPLALSLIADSADEGSELMATADAILQFHREDGGMCIGCELGFGQLKPFPCDQARWAADVVAQVCVTRRPQATVTHSCHGAGG